jgi:hypothetical protein
MGTGHSGIRFSERVIVVGQFFYPLQSNLTCLEFNAPQAMMRPDLMFGL